MTQVVAAAGAWAQAAAPGYGGVDIQAKGALGIMYQNSAADPGGAAFGGVYLPSGAIRSISTVDPTLGLWFRSAAADSAGYLEALAGGNQSQIATGTWSYAAAASGIVNTTTAVTIAAAAGAGLRNYITGLDISSAALGVGTEFVIRNGAAGTVLKRIMLGTLALPVRRLVLPTPIRSSANTLLEVVTLTASVTGGVYFNCEGYIAP